MREKAFAVLAKFIEQAAETAYRNDQVPSPLKMIENISYVEDNLEEHKLDVIYPDKEKPVYPFIINIHGGGFNMNSKDKIYRNYGMRLAGNEFAVVNINFRLSRNAHYPAQIEDVMSVITFLQKHANEYQLDMDHMFLSGDSSGAYMAAMAACILTDQTLRDYYGFELDARVQAVAANCGMYDFTTFLRKEIKFPMKEQIVEMLFGTKDYMKLEIYPYTSVLNHVNKDFPPIYLMDTEKQSFVEELYGLEKVLKAEHIDHQIHIFGNEENLMHAFHIMSKYEQSSIVINEIFQFFSKYL